MGSASASGRKLTSAQAMLVDSHCHVWDIDDPGSDWLAGQSEYPERVGVPDLSRAIGSEVTALVLVEAAASSQTTRKLLAIARSLPRPARVVGWEDLRLPDVSSRVGDLVAADEANGLAGVRVTLSSASNLSELSRGLDSLNEHGLVAEFLLGPAQLWLVEEIAREFPSLPVVVDHLAALSGVGDEMQQWEKAVAALAARPNTHVKLSGWRGISPHWVRAAVRRLADFFGSTRLMFGSDWPVSVPFGSHSDTVTATRQLLIDASLGERLDDVFMRTAARVFGLDKQVFTREEGADNERR